MSRLAGKTVIITGAGRGIGAVMAKRMAQEGANVVVTDVLDTKGTVEAITESGGSAIGISVDVILFLVRLTLKIMRLILIIILVLGKKKLKQILVFPSVQVPLHLLQRI